MVTGSESLGARRRPPSRLVKHLMWMVPLAPVLIVGAFFVIERFSAQHRTATNPRQASAQEISAARPGEFVISDLQRRGISLQSVQMAHFQATRKAEGKIALNEDKTTPVFSQYSSARVVRTFANSGDVVARGAPLLRIETPDMVMAASDLTTALATLDKARGQLRLAGTVEARQHELYEAKAGALKDWQQAQAELAAARNDVRSAESGLAAVRNRLFILGKNRQDVASLESHQVIDAATDIVAPIGGMVVQRKVGPGQYLTTASADPVYVLGDLSTVWLIASVKETDVPHVRIGQPVTVRVLAFPDRTFAATIVGVGAAVDPATRRLQVRAEVENPDAMLKPEMFAEFSIATGAGVDSPAIPASAVVREADETRVWVQSGENRFAVRSVRVGIEDNGLIQILSGLDAGDTVVSRGGLFIDRAAQPD